ncbi:MAG TPA: CHAT domain-containing protein, partial [Bacteroidales bacterium]
SALAHIPKLKDKAVEDLLYKIKSIDLQKNEEYLKAIDLTRKEICKYKLDDTLSIEHFHNLGGLYQSIGNKDSALYYYIKAKQLLDKKKDKFNQLSADIYNTYAYCQRYYLNTPLNAAKYYDSLLYVSEKILHKDSDYYAWNLFNCGIFYQVIGANNKALHNYYKAFETYQKINGNFDEECNYIQVFIASIELHLGNIQKASDKINNSVLYYKSTKDYSNIAKAYIFDAYLKTKLGKYREALNIYDKYIRLADSLKLSTKETHYLDIATCYVKINQKDSANYWFEQCFNTLKSPKKNYLIMLHTFLWEYVGFCLANDHIAKASEIIRFYESNLLKSYGNNSPNYALMLLCKARIADYQKEYAKGTDFYLQALKILENKSYANSQTNKNISLQRYNNLLAKEIIDCTTGLARDFKHLAQKSTDKIKFLQKSFEYYKQTLELMGQMNGNIPVEWDKLRFFEQFNAVKKEILEVKIAQYRNEPQVGKKNQLLLEAFEIADANKLSIMVEKLKEKQFKQQLGIHDSILKKDEKLSENISFLQHIIDEEEKQEHPDNQMLEKYYKLIFKTYNEYDSLREFINKLYPAIQDIYGANHLRTSYKQMIHCLPQNELLIEYAFTADSLYAFAVKNGSISLFSVPSEIITSNIQDFRALLTNVTDQAYTHQGITTYTNTAYSIYKQAVFPAIQNASFERLTIIPDGMLTFIPFEALVTHSATRQNADYGTLPYLCLSANINYTYSLALYSGQLSHYSNVASGITGYAPSYDKSSPLSPLRNAELRKKLKNLKGASDEVYSLVNAYGGRKLIGKTATETAFKQAHNSKHILHLAMHTVIDDENPMYSKLAFAEEKDSVNEGFLNTYEIYPLKINSPLVVLSACNTGYGKIIDGEGIVNLTRGFYYAGCNSLLITLWNISDQSSVQLMKLFYNNLDAHDDKNAALAKAKVSYIANSDSRYSHPYYWAGFIHSGNAAPLAISKIETSAYIILSVLLLITIGLFNTKWKFK